MVPELRLALLISGGGTTMREIIRASNDGRLPMVKSVLVIASRPDAGGIAKALEEGMCSGDVMVINPHEFPDEEAFGRRIIVACAQRGVNFIGQYGWMPHTPDNVINRFRGQMTNQHPGPPRDFGGKGMYGRRVHCARLLFVRETKRDYWTEAISQWVDPTWDAGNILISRRVEILPEDDVSSLQDRVLPIEHEVQIDTLKTISEQPLFVHGSASVSLVQPDEVELLERCKRIACLLYPKG